MFRLGLLLILYVNCAYLVVDTLEIAELKRQEPKFLLTTPKVLTAGGNGTVCLSVHEAALPGKVLLNLKIKDKNHMTSFILNSENDCFEIQVPKLRNHIKDALYAGLHLEIHLNGSTYFGHNSDPILIYPDHETIFLETDKSIYKPGDKVRIRVMVLNQDLKPPEGYTIAIIKILNPNGITVTVWEHIPTEIGLVQLDHQLAHDTSKGKWKIVINDISKVFQVKEYVLPRFKVTLNNPITIYASADIVKFSICGKYSYGQNMHGVATLKISFEKLNYRHISTSAELHFGCADFHYSSNVLHLRELVDTDLHLTATINEQGTSRTETTTENRHISNQAYSLQFINEKHFQPGLPYYGKLIATESLISLQGEVIQICYNIAVEKTWNIINTNQCSNFTFASDNTIPFSLLPLKDAVVQIRLHAKSLNQTIKQQWSGKTYPDKFNDEVSAYSIINRWYSPTSSYIQLDRANKETSKCKAVQYFTVYYTTGKLKGHQNITFHYMVKSRDKLYEFRSVTHFARKNHVISFNELQNVIGTQDAYTRIQVHADQYTLRFKLDPRIISAYKLIVYYVLFTGEVVAANIEVDVDQCLLNKVETNWSKQQYYPGERAMVTIKTVPQSLCALLALDKSTLYLNNGKILNVERLLKPFLLEKAIRKSNKLNCLPHTQKKNPQITTESTQWNLGKVRTKRFYGISLSDQYDAYEAFNTFGVSVITNLRLITKPCAQDETHVIPSSLLNNEVPELEVQFLINPSQTIYYDVNSEDQSTSIRSFFPETWLWELVPIWRHETKLSRDMPHTVTNWISSILCVSPNLGVGISPEQEITTFQPFFLEVITSSSIKREEVSQIEIILYNYLNHSLPIRVTLGVSTGLSIIGFHNEQSETHCIPAFNSKSVVFQLQGSKLGKMGLNVLGEVDSSYPSECGPEFIISRRDMVMKEIIVEPEGHQTDYVKSTLLCTNAVTKVKNITWELNLSDDAVLESANAKIIVNADLLGPAINNLEKLLLVPTGCGEQIMATLAPNLNILQYLNATGKLTNAIQQRTKRNLKIGYQRILEYLHNDGSFSAFGYYDRTGSMFLTAFVVQTLQKAKSYIYIDQNVIDRAVQWILSHQLENGCFASISHVFQDMGGTSLENSTAALTSYVLISFLESGIPLSETVKANAKYCIRGHFTPDKYTLAISTYALSLVGWKSEANRALRRLLQVATREDGLLWWSNSGSSSINVEMTAYVLMSLIYQNSTENLIHANSVVRWLASQHGPNGGFISTQDTVVALQAITKYATLLHTKDANLNVNIIANREDYHITLNANDRLKTKYQPIKEIPNEVKVTINGDGCVLVQAHLRYNLIHPTNSEAFKLAINVDPVSITDQCSVAIVSPCLSYTGPGLHANMAVLEITMPSGYEPDRASLFKLVEENYTKIKRFEENENQVIMYFTELNNEPVCVPFNINENSEVNARVEAIVKLYDYYNPELQVSTSYKVNKCLPNVIAPIPPLPSKNIIDVLDEGVYSEFNADQAKIVQKRQLTRNVIRDIGLNPAFVNDDEEMEVPQGSEGNAPVYGKLQYRKDTI